jgi:hypothetical protein
LRTFCSFNLEHESISLFQEFELMSAQAQAQQDDETIKLTAGAYFCMTDWIMADQWIVKVTSASSCC